MQADLSIDILYPAVINNKELVVKILPYVEEAAGKGHLKTLSPVMIAEDFADFAEEIPGMFFFLGIVPPDVPAEKLKESTPRGFMWTKMPLKPVCEL